MRMIILAAMLAAVSVAPAAHAAEDEATRAQRWHDLAAAIFEGRQPAELPGWVAIDAPMRALDAALVPITLTLAPDKPITGVYLIVDENPSPVAAHIEFGPAAETGTLTLRVRVDQYTNLHAVAETADGRLFATARFIKAAGGCSAPGAETPQIALQSAGRMKLRLVPPDLGAPSGTKRADLLIRHPNFNGMQMDQVTRLYTPARYVNSIEVAYNGQRVFHMQADVSLASDPAIGFGFRSDGPNAGDGGTLSVQASDTAAATWRQDFAVPAHGT